MEKNQLPFDTLYIRRNDRGGEYEETKQNQSLEGSPEEKKC